MRPHPAPSTEFAKLAIRTVSHPSAGPFWRVYRLSRKPFFFGKTASQRFDDPNRNFGVLYAGLNERAAFVESVGWDTGRRAIGSDELESRGILRFRAKRALKVFDLDGPVLTRIGADARLVAGDDHSLSRTWAAALHDHPAKVDGLRYRCRHDNQEFAIALFDRCQKLLTRIDALPLLDRQHEKRVADLLDHYDFAIL